MKPITNYLSWYVSTDFQKAKRRIQQSKEEVSTTKDHSREFILSHITHAAVRMQDQCTPEAPQEVEALEVHT